MAVWVSWAAPPPAYDCAHYDHCCNITSDIDQGLSQGAACSIGKPAWSCYTAAGAPWAHGEPVEFVNFMGGLANSPMAQGQKSLLLHIAPTADLSAPLTNSYAEHKVHDSDACRALCSSLQGASALVDLFADPNAKGCHLAQTPNIKAKAGYGRITVNGFGRINGRKMMEAFHFQDQEQSVWANPGAGVLNGYGSTVPKMTTIANTEAHTRWRIMSGLLELSSAGAPPPAASDTPPQLPPPPLFAVDVSEVAVGWGPKRGDGAIRLQFPRVPLDNGHRVEDSDVPVRLYDVKTPGTWVGASDGPRVTAAGSHLSYLYLQHADDNLKMDSSSAIYSNITLLQGNIGSAIELGTYGIGIRGNKVEHSVMDGVFVHRITHFDTQEDSLGSLLGSRTCPVGVVYRNLTLSNVVVAAVGSSNQVSSLFSIGTYGEQSSAFAQYSALDRWFFCANDWWLGKGQPGKGNTIRTSGQAALFTELRFLNWQVHVQPSAPSKL